MITVPIMKKKDSKSVQWKDSTNRKSEALIFYVQIEMKSYLYVSPSIKFEFNEMLPQAGKLWHQNFLHKHTG